MPFGYGNINKQTSYIDRSFGNWNYPSYYKLGEINVDSYLNNNYDKYLAKLNNSHYNKPLSKYNYSCPCQKLEN